MLLSFSLRVDTSINNKSLSFTFEPFTSKVPVTDEFHLLEAALSVFLLQLLLSLVLFPFPFRFSPFERDQI